MQLNFTRSLITLSAVALLALAALGGARTAEAGHTAGTIYTGASSDGGTVTVWVDATGREALGFAFTSPQRNGCLDYSFGAPVPINAVSSSGHSFSRTHIVPAGTAPVSTLTIGGTFAPDGTLEGTASWDAVPGSSCPSRQMTYVARRSTSTAVITGDLPEGPGFGLAIFGGGPTGHLILSAAARGCLSSSAVFWVSAGGEFVQFVPGTSIGAVNAAWNERFRNGIPQSTPLIIRCR